MILTSEINVANYWNNSIQLYSSSSSSFSSSSASFSSVCKKLGHFQKITNLKLRLLKV
jgi:hypothetical protein